MHALKTICNRQKNKQTKKQHTHTPKKKTKKKQTLRAAKVKQVLNS